MEIGISTGFFHKQSIFDSLRLIRNSGIKYLELWTFSKMLDSTIHFNPADKKEIEKVKKLLNDYSIKAVSIHTPFSEDMDISSENENKRSESVNYAVLSAEALCKISDNDSKYDKTIVIHPSSVPLKNREKETKTKFNQAKRSIEEIYNKVKTLNVKLALENQLPHIFGSDAQTLIGLLEGIPRQECGICFDTSHASFHIDTKIENFLKGLRGRILTLHISDSDLKSDRHLPPGEGKINWQKTIECLRTAGYSGIFMNEILEEIPGRDKLETMKILVNREEKFL